ncbi:MAG TPA: hypothetical protein PL124_13140, partial [Candidatus Cloacimonadota bacterium]|nr:hypothetical protein [Candidatus Cloacimonadota bacterium]
MLRGDINFLVSISDSEDLAKERTGAIAIEFLVNERLIMDFGESVNQVYAPEDFIVRNFCRCLARGYGQPIRGILFGQYRPDYIIIDDFESHNANNPKIAKQKNEYVRGEAYGALPIDDRGVVVWLGNLTHADSALNMFKKDCDQEPENQAITFKSYPAIIPDGSPQWPQCYTLEKLEQIKQAMGSIAFQRHFMMNPIQEGIKFLSAWFRFESAFPSRFEAIVSYCDPSLSAKATADYKAIITLGLAERRYYLLDCWIRRTSINAMIEKMYDLDLTFRSRIFMESVLWQKVLWEFIPPFSESKGYLLPVAGIENRLPKDQRIEAITPFFEWGWIIFPKDKTSDTIILEEQLLGFPSHPNDDGADALAGAIDCLKSYGRPMEYKSLKSGRGNRFAGI